MSYQNLQSTVPAQESFSFEPNYYQQDYQCYKPNQYDTYQTPINYYNNNSYYQNYDTSGIYYNQEYTYPTNYSPVYQNNSVQSSLADSGYSTNTSKQEIPTTPENKQNRKPSIKPTDVPSSPKTTSLQVNLTNTKLWSKFNDLTCEMIITKQGRRMFPTLQYGIDGLEPTKKYNVFVDIIPSEVTTMKFQVGKWIKSNTPASKQSKSCVYIHPESPNTGAFWMRNEVIFSKIKLTNNKKNPDSHMLLNSMHKYLPRLHIVEVSDSKENENVQTFMFPETKFIAVTAYQNTDVTQLKIDNNPFAKGFRENQTREYDNSVLLSSNIPSTPTSSISAYRPQNGYYASTPKVITYRNDNGLSHTNLPKNYHTPTTTPCIQTNYFQYIPTSYTPIQYSKYDNLSYHQYSFNDRSVLSDSTNNSNSRSIKRSHQESSDNDYYNSNKRQRN